jgi:hypothetical protein
VFELVPLVLFIAAPWALGYMSASYWAALLPAASLIAAVANYASDPPEGTDEVDVLPGLWIALSAIAVVICLIAAAVRRRTRRRP